MQDLNDSGNYYVGQVKRNQRNLFNSIQHSMATQLPIDIFEEEECLHGRKSCWSVSVYNALQNERRAEWANLSRFIHVHKCTIKNGEVIHSDRLYITNHFESSAEFYHSGIRGYWEIENNLHWVKDVLHKEDSNRIKKDNAPINYSVFSSIAINIHRKNEQKSIKKGQIINSSNVKELFETLIKAA